MFQRCLRGLLAAALPALISLATALPALAQDKVAYHISDAASQALGG